MPIPELSLRIPQFQFAEYKPIQYTQERPDINVLNRSMEKIEARKNMAYQTVDTVDKSLGAIESQLNLNEIEWFNNYKQDIRQQISQQIEAGNYGSAINIGTKLGAKVAQDTEILNRIKVNADYQNWVNSVKNDKTIDNLTKEMVLARERNQYNYNGFAEWKPGDNYVEDKPISVLQTMAFQMTAEKLSGYDNTTSGETMYDANGNPIANPMSLKNLPVGSQASMVKNSENRRRKEYEAMVQTWNDMMADPLIAAQLNQNYEKLKWAYEDRLSKSEDLNLSEEDRIRYAREAAAYRSQITDENGFIQDSLIWARDKVIPGLKNMAYDNIVTGYAENNNYSLGVSGKGRTSSAGGGDVDEQVVEDNAGTKTTPGRVITQYEPKNVMINANSNWFVD